MTRFRIALIGAGYMADEHARAFASLPSVEIAGVSSRSRARAEVLATKYDTRAFDSIEEMYRETRADAVVVAVNELSMSEVCVAAFAHPWLCLLEKPVGIDLSAAESILVRARSGKVRAYVALNRRSYSSTRQALEQLAEDDGPRLISVLDQEDMNAAREFGQPEVVVRNFMFANSIHLVDYLIAFGRGKVVSVDSVVPWTPELPRHVVSVIRFDSGDSGVYQAVWDGPGPWSASVTNARARLEMRPLEKLTIQNRGERRAVEIPIDPIDTEFKPGLRFQAEQIVLALKGQPASLPTLEDSMRTMLLCGYIYGLISPPAFQPF